MQNKEQEKYKRRRRKSYYERSIFRSDTVMRQNRASRRNLSDAEVWMQNKEQEKYKRSRS